ncbi:class I SAM-dependent methyltransferase [Vibrio palustris]|uniref:Cypemycin methyltransferase n=1 Tax=Vibrio palustris TaxID=1918946 RepID=A0A1R4B5P2_9VIBR|nr:class I SAM-dependent methyltransferase [Vibrio palustris]SJL84223.1 Cypemycin methyltransferase [Vibrio palustris]
MSSQQWNAKQYQQDANFVSDFGRSVSDLLNPQANEAILDLGCGTGELAEQIAQSGAQVYGVDASASMVQAMQQRGLQAEVMSGDALTFPASFDAVFSNAALHWMTDYQAVLRGVNKALKPNGRFVAEFGGAGNIQALTTAMKEVVAANPEMGDFRNPWYFPTAEEYQKQLEAHGFKVHSIELFARPTPLKSGVEAWLKIFANHIISGMPPALEETFLRETAQRVEPQLYSAEQGWVADYVRLRFHAEKVAALT